MRVQGKSKEKMMILVPNKHLQEVERRIESIRKKEEWKRLEYDCAKLREELASEFGQITKKEELVVGRRYGVIGYSIGANAVRRGQVLENTGEIYLYLWTYREDGVFFQTDAWGGVHESRLPGCPLIEL